MVKQADQCNVVRGYGDKERGAFSLILQAAALAAAGYNAYKALDIAKKQWDIAKRYWKIANNWLDYYKGAFAPVENQELQEAMELPITEPKYEIARGQARATAWIMHKGRLQPLLRCTSKYCTGLRQDITMRVTSALCDAVTLADGLGYRNERAYVEARNDVRWGKRMGTAKRGRDMVAESPAMAMAAAGIYGSLWEQTWKGLESAGTYLGYDQNRVNPRYPTTYLAGMENRGVMARQASPYELAESMQNVIIETAQRSG